LIRKTIAADDDITKTLRRAISLTFDEAPDIDIDSRT
jgi:hypothetical protein